MSDNSHGRLPPTDHPPYQAQLARAARFYNRMLDRVAPLRGIDEWLARYEDDVWSFFIHCWHVRDWTKHDDTIDARARTRILAAVEASHWLRVCADIANGRKHLVLRGARVGAEFSSLHTVGDQNLREWATDLYLVIGDSGDVLSAVEVGWETLHDWKRILAAENLTLPHEMLDLLTRPTANVPRCPPIVPPPTRQ